MGRNRAERRQASRRTEAELGWSVEFESFGVNVGACLFPELNHLAEADASVLLRGLILATVMDGARWGWWTAPEPWDRHPPPPDGFIRWRSSAYEGRPVLTGAAAAAGYVAMFGDPRTCVRVLTGGWIAMADGLARPVIGNEAGRYCNFAVVGVGGDT